MLDNPTDGSYNFAGNEVGGLKESQRTQLRKGNLGFVFQSFNLIDELTVYENVELPLIYLKMGKSERKENVMKVLERMKIAHREKAFSPTTVRWAAATGCHFKGRGYQSKINSSG